MLVFSMLLPLGTKYFDKYRLLLTLENFPRDIKVDPELKISHDHYENYWRVAPFFLSSRLMTK